MLIAKGISNNLLGRNTLASSERPAAVVATRPTGSSSGTKIETIAIATQEIPHQQIIKVGTKLHRNKPPGTRVSGTLILCRLQEYKNRLQ